MILILIFTVMLVFGIVLTIKDALWPAGPSLIALSIIALIFAGGIIIYNHASASVQIANYKLERERIINTYNGVINGHDVSIINKGIVMGEVYDWNELCNSSKYWSNNPWTNVFYNQEVVNTCAIPITEKDLNIE